MTQKLIIFSFLLLLFSAPVFSQIETTDYMNYGSYTKEFSVDVIPVLGGTNPTSLFFRNNYQREAASPMAFRLQFNIFNNFTFLPENTDPNLIDVFTNLYGLQIGKEWQKPLNEKMIAYSGVDFGIAYGNVKNRISNPQSPSLISENLITINYNATVFFGVKYHFHQRISASAEMGLQPNFQRNIIKTEYSTVNPNPVTERLVTNSFGFRLLPLNALRISYHF